MKKKPKKDNMTEFKTISNFHILGIIIALSIPITFGLFYYADFEISKSRVPFYMENYPNETLSMDVKLWNMDREKEFAIGDKLLFNVNYTKSDKILRVHPSIYLDLGGQTVWEKEIKEFDKISYFQDNSTIYSQIVKLNQTGMMVFGFNTHYTENKTDHLSLVKVFNARIPIDVKNISEIEQTAARKVVYQGLIASSIIGSATIIALIGNSIISKKQSNILEEQKNIMGNDLKFQIVDKRLAAYGSLQNFLQSAERRAKGWGGKDFKDSHVLEMPNGPEELREIFGKNYYLYSQNVNAEYHKIIEEDKDLKLAPKRQTEPEQSHISITDMPLSLKLTELQEMVKKEYSMLKNEFFELSGHKYE